MPARGRGGGGGRCRGRGRRGRRCRWTAHGRSESASERSVRANRLKRVEGGKRLKRGHGEGREGEEGGSRQTPETEVKAGSAICHAATCSPLPASADARRRSSRSRRRSRHRTDVRETLTLTAHTSHASSMSSSSSSSSSS
eukprot:973738-Rhodomonas_salina.1